MVGPDPHRMMSAAGGARLVHAHTANEVLTRAKMCVRLAGSAVSRHEWSAGPRCARYCVARVKRRALPLGNRLPSWSRPGD
jgi:hypothetical protein